MKVCIFAGSGDLPVEVFNSATDKGLEVFVIIIQSFGDASKFPQDKILGSLGISEVGKAINLCKSNDISNILFAGKVERPSLFSLKPDLEGSKLLAKLLSKKFLGDDNLLRVVVEFFETKGFTILSPSEFVISNKLTTKVSPNNEHLSNIKVGVDAFKKISDLDVGQSILVSEKRIIAIEGAEGTENLIKRSKEYLSGSSVLIKLPKTAQNEKVDMPTIGPFTIQQMHNSGISGVAINEKVIIAKPDEVIELADKLGIFIHYIDL